MKKMRIILSIALLGVCVYGAEFPICQLPLSQTKPAVAYDDNEKTYTIVYPSGGYFWGDDILATTIDESGNIVREFLIVENQFGELGMPSICFNGIDFLVTWTHLLDYSIWGVMVHQGQVGTPFRIVQSIYFPGVNLSASAWNGQNFLVVWIDTDWLDFTLLNGRLLDANGVPVSGIFNIFTHSVPPNWYCHPCYPDVASDGSVFIVAFNHLDDDQLGLVFDAWVYYRKVIDQNNMGPLVLLKERSGTTFSPSDLWFAPSVTFDGTNFYCTYHFLEESASEEIYNVYGAIIDPDGNLISNDIPIAVESGVNELCSAISAEDKNLFVVWQEKQIGFYNIYGRHYDQNGTPVSDKIPITVADDNQTVPEIAFDGINNLVVWQDYRDGVQWDIWGNLLPKSGFWTDDPLAFAYNGNRHLVRQPNSENLHLIYTDRGKVIYRYSMNGGADWTLPEVIGDGKFSAITLGPSPDYLPSVGWTNDIGGLYYGKKTAAGDWEVYQLYHPIGPYDPFVSSPPSIAVVPMDPIEDRVHILLVRSTKIEVNGVIHLVEDCSFPIGSPWLRTFTLIEGCQGPLGEPCRSYPSIAMCEEDNSLHGVWQRRDTVCYATKPLSQPWNVWGWQFLEYGLQSAHPMVECYGDMVYVVWQKEEEFSGYKEVYKGWRHLAQPSFTWTNFSQTPNTPSLYPVNASGIFTVWSDMLGPPNHNFEIYYKTTPGEPPINISQTLLKSMYSHSAARFTGANSYLYTAWLEGDAVPYEIRFKKIRYIPMEVPYLTAINGYETPSPYLVARDSFVSEWQIPVDIGYETITYQFSLEPGYRYKLKAIAYHESSGEWREWIKIDNKMKHQIKYNAYEPETLEFWIPPAFYEDGVIEVLLDRIKGDFAAIGPAYIYQYEYEEGEGGGPMARLSLPLNSGSITLFPNPFNEKLNIRYQITENNNVNLKIYDVTGRLVKQFNHLANQSFNQIVWNGEDENGRVIAQGIYFLQIENLDSGETFCKKILKIK